MPTEERTQTLAKLVKTTQSRLHLIEQIHTVLTSFSTTTPLAPQDIKNMYPVLAQILQEYNPDTSTLNTQTALTQMLEDLQQLEELIITIPQAVSAKTATTRVDELVKLTGTDKLLAAYLPDMQLVAGLTLAYKGRLINLSLNKIIKEKVYG